MKLIAWLKPGMKLKRWLATGLLGILFVCLGLALLAGIFFPRPVEAIWAAALFPLGLILIFLAIRKMAGNIHKAVLRGGFEASQDAGGRSSMLYDKRILIKGPKIVTIGGGTGLSAMLRGLKTYSSNLTAIVTVADDGGGSGVLRQDLGMLPPGDIRNCIMALANTEPIMESLLQYRFKEGMLKGQSFGNLFLAAMDGISSNFEEAVRRMSDVLAVTGRVLPVTLEDARLFAELDDGYLVSGESNIGKHYGFHPGRIQRVYMEPANAKPLQDVLDAIAEADIIVLGPGSLYTSIIPNLLVDGVCEALRASSAPKIYVCNIMTQPGETEGYSLYDHLKAIEGHSCKGIIDYCLVNTAAIPPAIAQKYRDDGAQAVVLDIDRTVKSGIKVIGADFVGIKNNYVRHDPTKLAEAVMGVATERALPGEKKRLLEFYYGKEGNTTVKS